MDDLDVADDLNLPSTSASPSNGATGITLVLPSLRALKAANANAGKKTSKGKQSHALDDAQHKIPRPIKLKPLKEVLTKLIAQIKKKDDYAFFIQPVDPRQVPGYADVIKNPMDFGTMGNKVARGRYRSLDEFSNDFRLVTTNAKTFNPPGSIYYSEAERLEAWGLEHIARASAYVIEYETDWNIDVEQDGEPEQNVNISIDDEVSTPRERDLESMAAGSRGPSMTPAPGQATQGRRGPRGPYKKHAQAGLSEGLDADGKLPGAKDGVGAFPAGSDWAELMVALKIKGKRYKTKKERLRFEKEGPPYCPDGSLDYSEMEDPFSVLNVFVPEPPTRPQVTPLYPPASYAVAQPRMRTPTPVTIPSDRPIPVLSTLSNLPTDTTTPLPPKKRRHWTIVRNAPARLRGKDKEGDATTDDAKSGWKVPHDAGPGDYGTFATFLGELVASAVGPHASGNASIAGAVEWVYGSESRLFATIRSTVERRGVKRKREACPKEEEGKEVWTDEDAQEAWDYLRDVVYGGVDGYAYVRSLAEFVAPAEKEKGSETLARFVEDNLVDMVTRGRHGWLRDVMLPGESGSVIGARSAKLPEEQLDVAALVRAPEELAMDGVLEGGQGGDDKGEIERALAWGAEVIAELAKVKREEEDAEDALVKRLRMNLLALAKRLPQDSCLKSEHISSR